MAQITIRNLDPRVVERLKKLAAANGRSLEAELRLVLARLAKGGVVGEEGSSYDPTARAARSMLSTQTFGRPKVVRYPAVKPILLSGEPVSELLIEDRR